MSMTTFHTPEPISATFELGVADIRIEASERDDTVVEVRASDPANKSDVTAAEQTRVEYADGRLLVRAPKGWRQWAPRKGGGSIDVRIDLPVGSRVRGETGVGTLRCSGALGECSFTIGVGDIQLGAAGSVELKTGAGDVTVDTVVGRAQVTTGSGAVQIGSIDGTAVVRNGNGDTWIGEAEGDARVNAANGKISIDRARSSVAAKTANGHVRLGEVTRGAIVAQSAFGTVEVGVREGVSAWLDLDTKFGNVQNDLDQADRPEPGEDTVEVHARTSLGDITIHRSLASHTGKVEA
jgi:hypothetical protein